MDGSLCRPTIQTTPPFKRPSGTITCVSPRKNYPPESRFITHPMGKWSVSSCGGQARAKWKTTADALAERLEGLAATAADFRLLGPAPAPIAKLRGQFRFHLIVQSTELSPVRDELRRAQQELDLPDDVLSGRPTLTRRRCCEARVRENDVVLPTVREPSIGCRQANR